jgi:hypothetical protein
MRVVFRMEYKCAGTCAYISSDSDIDASDSNNSDLVIADRENPKTLQPKCSRWKKCPEGVKLVVRTSCFIHCTDTNSI